MAMTIITLYSMSVANSEVGDMSGQVCLPDKVPAFGVVVVYTCCSEGDTSGIVLYMLCKIKIDNKKIGVRLYLLQICAQCQQVHALKQTG